MVRNGRRRGGFSLVELMMVMGILGALLAVLPGLVKALTDVFWASSTQLELQRDGRDCLRALDDLLRQGKGSTVRVFQEAGEPFMSRIEFATVSPSTWTIYQDNRKIYAAMAAPPKEVCWNVNQVAFLHEGASTTNISVHLVVEKNLSPRRRKSLTLTSRAIPMMN